MIRKLLNSSSHSIASAAIIVASFSIFSRVIGFIRDRILAGAFGASDTLDIYFAAFRVPDLLFQLIVVGALSASFIPLFTRVYSDNDRQVAWNLTNKLLNVIALAFLVTVVIAAVFADPFAALVAPGFEPWKQAEVASMSRLMFVAQFFLAISMVFGSALQGAKRFVLYSMAPIVYNVGIICGAVFFVPVLGTIGLAWGVIFGAMLHLFLQALGIFSLGYRYRPLFAFHDKDVRYMAGHMLPRVLGLAVNQLNFVAMTIIATMLAAGSVTMLQFAYNLNFFPIGVIAVSYAIAAFPTFCEHMNKKDVAAFRASFSGTVRQTLLFMVPATALFILLRAQVVRVVLGAGMFDWNATILTANTLGLFALSFVAQSIIFILVRGYFAADDTKTPFFIGLISGILNIVLALLLTESFGVLGFGAAYSLSATVQMLLLWIPLSKRLHGLDERRIVRSLGVFVAAGFLAAIVTQAVKVAVDYYVNIDTFWGIFAQGAIAGTIGFMVYIALTLALKSEEMRAFLVGIQRKLLRKAKVQEEFVSEIGQ